MLPGANNAPVWSALKDVAARLYGAKEYLDKLVRFVTVEKLNKAEFTGFSRSDGMISTFCDFGLTVTQDDFSVSSEKHLVQWEITKRGIALGMMMGVVGDRGPLAACAITLGSN